jgi:hypothetical protein
MVTRSGADLGVAGGTGGMGLSGGRRGRGGWMFLLVRAGLAVALLIPVGALFGMVWQASQDGSTFATRERHGVSYVNALVAVELSLADSQTAAMTGRSVSTQPLSRSIGAAAAADARYGDELRTHERWAELRARIEGLATANNSDAMAAYSASEETADLLLALIEKVRTSSGLIRDPDSDTYYLQDAAAQELPEAIVMSSRLVGLALLTVARPSSDQDAALAELLSSRASLLSNIGDLADDVRQTVDTTKSRTLGGNLLAPLDRFRQAADTLIPAATAIKSRSLVINPVDVGQSWGAAQAAVGTLSTVMLTEIDGLLVDRLDSLGHRGIVAIALLLLAVLLAVGPPVVRAGRRRRRRGARPTHAWQAGDPRVFPGGPGGPGGTPGGVPGGASGGAAIPAAWERAGAAR